MNRSFAAGSRIFSEGEKAGLLRSSLRPRQDFQALPEGRNRSSTSSVPARFSGGGRFYRRGFPAHASAERSSSLPFFPREAFVELIRRDASLALGLLAVYPSGSAVHPHGGGPVPEGSPGEAGGPTCSTGAAMRKRASSNWTFPRPSWRLSWGRSPRPSPGS